MKKLYTILAAVLITASTFAQAPEKMSYQAILRDGSNTLLTNQEVGMQISILQTTITGTAVYTETQTATTNINGLVSIEIGSGTSSNNFSAIDWSAGPYFIKTATDPTGGTSYTITGTSQLMSVPFAMYAKTSGSSTPGPQGEPGAQGTNGTPGIQGETGTAGADGTNGEKGDTGDQGAQGIQGTQGAAGLTTAVNAIAQIDGNITLTTTNIPEGDNKYYTEAAVSANTAVAANTAKVGYTEVLVSANTAVVANTAKVGYTDALVSANTAVTANTDKVGITAQQSDAITTNTDKVGYTEALVSANADVVLNKSKVGQAAGTTSGDMQYWNGTTWVVIATTSNEGAALQLIGGIPTWVGGTPPPPATVGDLRASGIVFWVDPTDNTHGLVCALEDYQSYVDWGCDGTDLPSVPNFAWNSGNPVGAGVEIGDGEPNTTGMLADCPSASAALAARSYGPEWFLPSVNELNEIYINKATLEAVSGVVAFSGAYWSSTEFDFDNAWSQGFDNGNQYNVTKNFTINVRAVRAF
jgi:hypothetical protein